ncbi:hypothetical protein FQN57_000889 [Myotisia sp. PD_48]|nr:hypothetical protein FQN57_000889 [Myotisia sp. PD_48]
MSADSQPISHAKFAEALQSLPSSSLWGKILELNNSISHLVRSNLELKRFIEESSEGGDNECEEAVAENEGLVKRMSERIQLVEAELAQRGESWKGTNTGGSGGSGGGDGDGDATQTGSAAESSLPLRHGSSPSTMATDTNNGERQAVEEEDEPGVYL